MKLFAASLMLAILACAPARACTAAASAGELRLRAEFAAGAPRADLVFIGWWR